LLIVRAIWLLLACILVASANAEVRLTEGTNISADVSEDGRIVMDLLGGIWIMPADGGTAERIEAGLRPVQRPRWSPAGTSLIYQASGTSREELWLHTLDTGVSERLDDGRHFNQHPSWHRDGERVVFSSDRNDSEFDLWEIDLDTRLAWRLSSLPGHETEPAWSGDGRNLLYVHQFEQQWSLMIRRHGQRDQAIVNSAERIAAPSWRPDGSLVTYMLLTDDGWTLRMAILSDPILDREIIAGEDLFLAPVAWRGRQLMLYTADGHIRKRPFNSWTSANVPFRANVGSTSSHEDAAVAPLELPDIDPARGTSIIRAARLFDGLGKDYVNNADIIIEDGRVIAVEEQRDRDGAIIFDLGDVTVLPGFIDAHAKLAATTDASIGPLLLGLGVTTLVAAHPDIDRLNEQWSGKDLPGPRILAAKSIYGTEDSPTWPHSFGVASGTAPTSPGGRSYADVELASRASAMTLVSGLADRNTPNLDAIRASRVASLLSPPLNVNRRFANIPDLSSAATSVVLGSAANGLPPGIALHAELRALVAAGLSGEQAMKAAGVNAAASLGAGLRLGRIAPGAAADLLLVDGDPLADVNDALRIVAVVRNGRFFSISGLVDRANQAEQTAAVE
jgi:hypothetical protein